MKPVAIYHTVRKNETFERAANDLVDLIYMAQQNRPNVLRILFLDIEGHRNSAGGFDADMLELQKEFMFTILAKHLTEIHTPLYNVRLTSEQDNNIPQLKVTKG